jgi:hypothetical protein
MHSGPDGQGFVWISGSGKLMATSNRETNTMAIDIKTTEGSTSTSTLWSNTSTGSTSPFAPAVRFGDDWFALKAEALASFSGTPWSLIV